jgi:hypothetical protein
MATYLDRYVRGEHEPVWAELVALGGRVREPGVYADAVAVARETMRRARANVERIVARLRGMNFDFAYPDRVFVPPAPRAADVLENLERRIGPLPIGLRAFYEIVGSVSLVGSYPGLSTTSNPPIPARPSIRTAQFTSGTSDRSHRLTCSAARLRPTRWLDSKKPASSSRRSRLT